MKNKSILIVIFSLFFFNTPTECMLTRVSQLVVTKSKKLSTKAIIPDMRTLQDSTPLSNEEKNKQLIETMREAVKEELARRNKEETSQKKADTIPSWSDTK